MFTPSGYCGYLHSPDQLKRFLVLVDFLRGHTLALGFTKCQIENIRITRIQFPRSFGAFFCRGQVALR